MREAFNVRIEELKPIDVAFLDGFDRPTLCLLHEHNKNRYVVTYHVDSRAKALTTGPWKQALVEKSARLILPIQRPWRGVIVFGSTTITYLEEGKIAQTISIKETHVMSCGKIDEKGTRYLVGDTRSCLYVLVLIVDSATNLISGLAFEYLGKISIASALCYLDSGITFVGSSLGDSQLIRLKNKTPGSDENAVEVLSSYTGIGPILDMCVVTSESHGQTQVICSTTCYVFDMNVGCHLLWNSWFRILASYTQWYCSIRTG
jgi:DNA damage-binding protein 1